MNSGKCSRREIRLTKNETTVSSPETFSELLTLEKLQNTIERLHLRISERFPESSLSKVCLKLFERSQDTQQTIKWIQKPNYSFRIFIYGTLLILVSLFFATLFNFKLSTGINNIAEFIQMVEAGTNEAMLITAGVVFLIAFDNRRKRKRIIEALNTLRNLAHLVDVHQLTKDPIAFDDLITTEHSPKRKMTEFEMNRYLDYCSEILSLTSKLGVIYVQRFNDPVANDAVEDLEDLTSSISNKIYQKIIVLGNVQLRNELQNKLGVEKEGI
jgi:hypothetical protein